MTRISICWLFMFTLAAGCTAKDPDGDHWRGKAARLAEGDAYVVSKCGDGKCDTKTEDCKTCPKDCTGTCDACNHRITPGCKNCACEKWVCAKDPYCCSGKWDTKCAGYCKGSPYGCGQITEAGIPDLLTAPGDVGDLSALQPDGTPDLGKPVCGNKTCEPWGAEDCENCAKDCPDPDTQGNACYGCQPRFKPGCKGCKCEACVCKKHPLCCLMYWHPGCVQSCKIECKGCSTKDSGMPDKALPDGFGLKCGDGTCVEGKEFCDTCPKDCGQCDGCKVKKKASCKGCKCETEVCKKEAACCSAGWGNLCVTLCKFSTLGCGRVADMGVDQKPTDIKPDRGDIGPDLYGQQDMNYQASESGGRWGDWRSNPKYWEAGTGASNTTSKLDTGCSCELDPAGPPPYLVLLALGLLVLVARRRS